MGEDKKYSSNLLFYHLIDISPIPIALSAPNEEGVEEFELINRKFSETFGYTIDDMRTVDEWWPLAYPDETYREYVKQEWIRRAQEAMRTKSEIEPMEAVVRCKDGSLRHVEGRLSSIGNKNINVLTDLTELKQAFEDALEKETKFKNIVQSSPMGMHMYSLQDDGQLVFSGANPAADRILGVDNSRFIGQTIEQAFPALAETDIPTRYREIAEGKAPWMTEHVNYEDQHIVGAFEIHAFQTAPNSMTALFLDISERKQAEIERQRHAEELAAMQQRLQQAEKMEAIGRLAGGVAHDFNNQLAGIMGYADLLKDALKDNTPLYGYADSILKAAERSAHLTGQLLAFARKGKYFTLSVDIHQLLDEALDLLSRSLNKNIVVNKHFSAQALHVLGDPHQLQNALLNILLNARDAMPHGGVLDISTASVTLQKHELTPLLIEIEAGAYLQIVIRDTGAGMSKDTLTRLFEPFFTTKTQGKGTGLGMAAVYGIVKNHKGSLQVTSEHQRGTTVTLYLPLTTEELQQTSAVSSEAPSEGTAGRVLLIDDETLLLEVGTALLTSLGYRVDTCSDGVQAVELYRQKWQLFDVIILDMIMPRMNGKEAFWALRAINPRARIILSSGYSLDSEAQELLGAGKVNFLQKPFKRDELGRLLSAIIHQE